MGILDGYSKDEPLHYGEVYSIWTSLLTTNAAIGQALMLINHAGDDDLIQLLQESVKLGQEEAKKLEKVLKKNGVALPPSTPEPPEVNLDDIPVGARFQDPAIAAAISAEISASLVTCSQIMGQSIREDIAMMFGQFHQAKAALGAKYLKLNKEKGWLIPPPLHHHNPPED